jgi:hypothetical protein
MAMESIAVNSSAIAYLAYDSETGEVSISFNRGGSYKFEMPEIEVHRMAESASPGGYWNANVKGKY